MDAFCRSVRGSRRMISCAAARPWRRVLAVVPLAAALLPPVMIGRVVVRDAVNVPFMDQWAFAGSVGDAVRGVVSPSLVWQPNNEHRIVIPRLIMLGLARFTRWDVRYEVAVSFLIALGTLATLAALIVRTVWPRAPVIAPWLVLVASLQTFSLAQWENWTWGWQMSLYLNAFAATVVASGVASFGDTGGGFVVILLAAIAAALSFASGLALLVLVPLAVLAAGGRAAARQTMIATLVSAAMAIVYFAGFQPVGNQPPHTLPWGAPVTFPRYVVAYLGAAFAAGRPGVASSWGSAGLVTLTLATARLWRAPRWRAALVPWLLLGLYPVLAGVLIAIGRLGAGPSTALLSRYTTIAAPFWTGVAVLLAMALVEPARTGFGRAIRAATIALLCPALVVAALGYRETWAMGDLRSGERAARLRSGGACLSHLETAPDACLRLLCWDAQVLRFFANPLRTLQLGPFAPGRRLVRQSSSRAKSSVLP